MSSIFRGAAAFNVDIWKWDVSSVKDMREMFWAATSFNDDISKWDVSGVTDMRNMFSNTNGDISQRDVSNVNNMSAMFSNSDILKADISKWRLSSEGHESNVLVCEIFQW